MAVLLALAAAWLMPPRKVEPPPCLVTLLSMQAPGGGAGMNGTLSKGNGEPALLPPPEPEASVEPGKNDTMQPPEMEKETIPLVPVPAKIEKPKKKPKIEPVPKPPKKQEIIAKTENPMPPAAPAVTNSDARNPSGASLSGQEEGLGGDAGEGDNVGHPKTGTGSGARGINGQGGDTVGFGGGEWG